MGNKPESLSFPGRYRVKTKRDFADIQSKGARVSSKYLLALVAVSKTGDSRLGLIITKKLEKRATRRNKLKRRLKEAFRQIRGKLRAPRDIVIVARRGAIELSAAEVKEELLSICLKAKIITEDN